MGFPIGVLICVYVEINDLTVFRSISLIRLVSHVNLVYQTNPRAAFVFYN